MTIEPHMIVNYVLLLVVVATLVVAAVSDLRSYTIPNACSIVLIAAFPIAVAVNASLPEAYDNLLVSVTILVLGFGLYAIGKMGAGDVKLLAAIGLWAGADQIVPVVFAISVVSLVLVLLLLLARHSLTFAAARWRTIEPGHMPRVLQRGEYVPLGVAISIGTLAVLPTNGLFAL